MDGGNTTALRVEAGTQPDSALPEPLGRFVARKLGEAIEAGEYRPGERLSEEKIAARFGVSRGTVREALGLLEREELAVIIPRRGARVIDFTPEEIDHMFEMRAVLYGLAVEGFARRASADARAEYCRMAGARSRAEIRAQSPEDYARANQAVSAFIVAHCGNPRVVAAMRKMTRQTFRFYSAMAHRTAARREETAEGGRRVVEAIRNNEPETAGAIARAIVEANRRAVAAALKEQA